MSTEKSAAQLLKLARTLGVPVRQLSYLADVADQDLRQFRLQVTDLFLDGQESGLRRVASAAKVIPTPIIAKLVNRNRNALLAARMSGVLEPSHAVEVAKRLPVEFLADIAALLDPRHAAAIIGSLPEATIVAVGKVLAVREDWITLGDLVAAISDAAARATEAALDGTALVRTAFLVDDAAQLERFVTLASQSKLAEMLAATAEHDLWSQYRGTLAALSEPAIEAVTAAAERLPVEHRDRARAEIADRHAIS